MARQHSGSVGRKTTAAGVVRIARHFALAGRGYNAVTNRDREDEFVVGVVTGVDPLTAYAAASDGKRKPWLTWKLAVLAVIAEILSVVWLYKMVRG